MIGTKWVLGKISKEKWRGRCFEFPPTYQRYAGWQVNWLLCNTPLVGGKAEELSSRCVQCTLWTLPIAA